MISLTLAQLNPVVGDLNGNATRLLDVWRVAETDLVAFPELVLSGYPPEDLIINPNFINKVEAEVKAIQEASLAELWRI